MTSSFLIALASLLPLTQATGDDGAILSQEVYTFPPYESAPGYVPGETVGKYWSKELYRAATEDARFELRKVRYESAGLVVVAYTYAPRSAEEGPRPTVVFNRGSFNDMSGKLAEAERLNSRLLHDVSHEFRSPLGRIQVLAETIAERLSEKEECIRGIEQEIRLLDRLVGDLLQVARIESDQHRARHETFSIQHWSGETLGRLERSARSKGIGWTTRLPEEDAEVRGDPEHLALALANLVDNAIHALGGRQDPAIEVVVARDGKTWTMVVADNGPGIPKEHLPHVFRRFYRADEHRDREAGGVGLGLSLVRAIAEAHGGGASIESCLSQGTRVTISLPIIG